MDINFKELIARVDQSRRTKFIYINRYTKTEEKTHSLFNQ